MTDPADHVYAAIGYLLNSLYPAERGPILERLWRDYNMDAPRYDAPRYTNTWTLLPEGQPTPSGAAAVQRVETCRVCHALQPSAEMLDGTCRTCYK